ncbi:MAG: 2,4-diaminopentanoate dehydrogenase [Sedimenticola sp.]
MREKLRVLILGSGQMGTGIARLVLGKEGMELVALFARRGERAGMDLGLAIGLGKVLGIPIEGDLESLIEQSRPQVAIQATCSRLDDAMGELSVLLGHGVPVISIAEEMAYPASSSVERAKKLHRLAQDHGVALVGTGINPGFILDLLVITLSGVCSDIHSITARRVNDLSPYGPSVLKSQGVGLTQEAFYSGLEEGSVVGHFGFGESLNMIADALGWELDRVEEQREPIITRVRRETPFITLEPGRVAGCFHQAIAYRQGEPVITLIHPQQIHPALEGIETGDRIEIDGTPSIRLEGSPEIPGGVATCALAVNMIPRILNASPGLHTMADLPPPAALLGDVREMINIRGSSHG